MEPILELVQSERSSPTIKDLDEPRARINTASTTASGMDEIDASLSEVGDVDYFSTINADKEEDAPQIKAMMHLSLGVIPDEVILHVLQNHDTRCQFRSLSSRCRSLVESHFEIKHYTPPAGQVFNVDFEINSFMSKHLFCAQFGGPFAGDAGGVSGAVNFTNWVPAYYRGKPGCRDIRHRLNESDACALWRIITKVRDDRSSDPTGVMDGGYLTVSEGGGSGDSIMGKREVIGRLSALDSDLVLQVLDHRRNLAAEPILVA